MAVTLGQGVLLFASAFAAGAVNSVAGGGTLLTFPALLAVGVSPLGANATSTVALVPGSASAFWGYRQELGRDTRALAVLALPSVLGGIAGAKLTLAAGDALFARLVPWLILAATVLFVLQEPLSRWLRGGAIAGEGAKLPAGWRLAGIMAFQFLVAVYGGFFGAGIGILMLAAFGLAGMANIHHMNAFKTFAAVCINGVAAVTFVFSHRVEWPLAALMAAGAIAGGYGGADLARRLGQRTVRRVVVAIGFGIAVLMFTRR